MKLFPLNSSLVAFALGLLVTLSACSKQAEAPKTVAAPAPSAVAGATIAKTAAVAALPVVAVAPAWKLKDVNGVEVTSAQFKGKVVVVDFWATWCPPCREEIPGYIQLVKKYGKDGLVIVGVSLDQAGPSVVKTYAEKTGVNYPLVMGDDEVVAAFGGMEAIPTTFLIDRDGKIRDRKVGAEPTADYEKKIVALLK